MDEKTPTRPFDPGNVLFRTGEDGDRDEAACMALSGVGDPANADVLLVTFTGTTRERLDAWKRHADAPPANIGVVSVESGSSSGNNGDDGGGPPVRHVSDPSDLTGVNIAISEFLSGWADTGNRTLVCFESLTALLQYADSERVFQFCNEITSKFERAGASAHFHVTTEAHEPRVLNGLSSLFEGRVEAADVDCGFDASEAPNTPDPADAADGSDIGNVDDTPDAADSSDASDTSDADDADGADGVDGTNDEGDGPGIDPVADSVDDGEPDGADEDVEAETSGLTASASEPAEAESVDDPFEYGESRTTPDGTGTSTCDRCGATIEAGETGRGLRRAHRHSMRTNRTARPSPATRPNATARATRKSPRRSRSAASRTTECPATTGVPKTTIRTPVSRRTTEAIAGANPDTGRPPIRKTAGRVHRNRRHRRLLLADRINPVRNGTRSTSEPRRPSSASWRWWY